MPYFDLHQHLKNLEEHGLLRRITRLINKDTELHPLVRWQFIGGTGACRKKIAAPGSLRTLPMPRGASILCQWWSAL